MARTRYSDKDVLLLFREIELSLASGSDVASACRSAGLSDAAYYTWRKRFGDMGRTELANLKALQKENDRLRKIVAELELDKLILKPCPADRLNAGWTAAQRDRARGHRKAKSHVETHLGSL